MKRIESDKDPEVHPAEADYVSVVEAVLRKGVGFTVSDLQRIALRVNFSAVISDANDVEANTHLTKPLSGDRTRICYGMLFTRNQLSAEEQASLYDPQKTLQVLGEMLPDKITDYEGRMIGQIMILTDLRKFGIKFVYPISLPQDIKELCISLGAQDINTEGLSEDGRSALRKSAVEKIRKLSQLQAQGINIPFTDNQELETKLRVIVSWIVQVRQHGARR